MKGEAIKEDEMHSEPTDSQHLMASRTTGNPRVAIIRTSDRIAFRSCRRRWGWSSHLRHNLGPISAISPLWFGSGIHFALEDFHGWNRFGHPKAAFLAYVAARQAYDPHKIPDDVDQLIELGSAMMDYYVLWLQQRKNSVYRTYWHNGQPQVEVNFRIKIPWPKGKFGYDEVYYSGTIDRVVEDEYGLLWPKDYKTAARMETLHFLTDPQINAYMWAAPYIYPGKDIGGFMYQQHLKQIPKGGQILQSGVSANQNQLTSSIMYRNTLIDVYKSVDRSPAKCQEFLNNLLFNEDELRDRYIQIDKINRNERNAQAEGTKVLMEIEDMLNPDLPLYPNPTRDCSGNYPCAFLSPCISMDDGSDWRHELEMVTEPRDPVYDSWRQKIIWPGSEAETNQQNKKLDLGDRSWLDTPTD